MYTIRVLGVLEKFGATATGGGPVRAPAAMPALSSRVHVSPPSWETRTPNPPPSKPVPMKTVRSVAYAGEIDRL